MEQKGNKGLSHGRTDRLFYLQGGEGGGGGERKGIISPQQQNKGIQNPILAHSRREEGKKEEGKSPQAQGQAPWGGKGEK